MHSSTMHTARLLTVSCSIRLGCLPGGVCHTYPRADTPWTDTPPRQTPSCPLHAGIHRTLDRQTPMKTLPSQTSFAGGKDIVPENVCENVCYLTFYFIVKPHSNFTRIFTHSPMHINITMIVVVNVLGCLT